MTLDLQTLRAVGIDAGLTAVGATTAEPFGEVRVELERRRGEGLHAGMQFTYRNPARSTDPSRSLADARTLVVGAYAFAGARSPSPAGGPGRSGAGDPAVGRAVGSPRKPTARVAAYAAEDHYAALRAALTVIAERIRAEGHRAVVLADANNLVDRAAAHRAGLGWWGKSSNILVPGLGSMVVLGSVLTDAEIAVPDAHGPLADGCGACSACMAGCPTGAIVAPGTVDANRCLAWLLQAEGVFPVEYREALGDRIYGCDDCQDACPPNRARASREANDSAGTPHANGGAAPLVNRKQEVVGLLPDADASTALGSRVDLIEMLDLDDEALMARFGRWYVARRDPAYLRRNALVVLANIGCGDDADVQRVLRDALAHHSPIVRSHAVWAARRLGLERLSAAVHSDPDSQVQLELARA